MSRIKLYHGKNLTDVKDDTRSLIDSVIWERDIVMLLGTEKSGKSILAQQIAFSLTSGYPLFGKYRVPEPAPILYLQTEGKDAEMARRIECMASVLPINRAYFYRAYKKFLPLDVADFKQELIELVKPLRPHPRVMFLDSLYTSMVGDLTSNRDVRYFLAELSSINDLFNMASVVIHHEVKDSFERGENGKYEKVKQGDKRSYGSVFLRAFVEHILFLNNEGEPRNKQRTLRCDTTRTGQVLEHESLTLLEPNPLLFDITEDHNVMIGLIQGMFMLSPKLLERDIAKMYPDHKESIFRALRFMASMGEVRKEDDAWIKK